MCLFDEDKKQHKNGLVLVLFLLISHILEADLESSMMHA